MTRPWTHQLFILAPRCHSRCYDTFHSIVTKNFRHSFGPLSSMTSSGSAEALFRTPSTWQAAAEWRPPANLIRSPKMSSPKYIYSCYVNVLSRRSSSPEDQCQFFVEANPLKNGYTLLLPLLLPSFHEKEDKRNKWATTTVSSQRKAYEKNCRMWHSTEQKPEEKVTCH